jgi:DNA polymerase-3 subunit delta'
MTSSTQTSAAIPGEIIAPFDQLVGQEIAARFLSAVVRSSYTPQGFLFVGPLGAGKTQAAEALAQSLLCPNGGADNCNDCRQVKNQTHPDLRLLVPEGANGYLAEQIQELNHDVTLAPMRGSRKVYIINSADKMTTSFANGFLKTLEEPPASTVFILISRSLDSIIPTIRSRCQIVPFVTLSENEAFQMLVAPVAGRDGSLSHKPITPSDEEMRVALAYSSGSVSQAREFLRSHSYKELKNLLFVQLRGLLRYDSLDVLEAAKALVLASKLPLDQLVADQQKRLEEGKELLSKGALSNLEQRLKRELTAAEKSSASWVIQAIRIWLRDLLLAASGCMDQVVNSDQSDLIKAYLSTRTRNSTEVSLYMVDTTDFMLPAGRDAQLTAAILRCLEASSEAIRALDYNVSVQSIFEFLLFTINDELGERER